MEGLHRDPRRLERKSPNSIATHLGKKEFQEKILTVLHPASTVYNSYSFGITESFGIA
jgi:hypothetical protein